MALRPRELVPAVCAEAHAHTLTQLGPANAQIAQLGQRSFALTGQGEMPGTRAGAMSAAAGLFQEHAGRQWPLTGLVGAAAAPVFFFCSLGGACGSALGTEPCTNITIAHPDSSVMEAS